MWLLGQGSQCSLLILISPIGWGLLTLAWIMGNRAKRDKCWPLPTWCALAWPLTMSFVCVAWAQKNQRNPGDPGADRPMTVLNFLMLLYLVGFIAIIHFNRPARAATTAVLSLGSFLFLGCSLVSSMAITGMRL